MTTNLPVLDVVKPSGLGDRRQQNFFEYLAQLLAVSLLRLHIFSYSVLVDGGHPNGR